MFIVAVIPDPRAARSLRFSPSENGRTVDGYHPSTDIIRQRVQLRAPGKANSIFFVLTMFYYLGWSLNFIVIFRLFIFIIFRYLN